MKLRAFADYHTHTLHSHGQGTVRQNAEAAYQRGLREVGIADHGPATRWGLGVESIETYRRIRREVDECNEAYGGMKVLLGCEANLIDYEGHLDVPLSAQKNLDKVLAGFHRMIRPKHALQGIDFVAFDALAGWSGPARRRSRTTNTKAVIEALYRNRIDILTHPGLNIRIDTAELAKASVKTGTSLEINCHHARDLLDFVRVAAAQGAQFVIDSDAHHPSGVGRLDHGIDIAERAGLTPDQIANVEPAQAL